MSSDRIRLDLNNEEFQQNWISLSKDEAEELRKTLKKLYRMTWDQVFQSKGIHWEAVHSVSGPAGEPAYTIRISRQFRALVYRQGDFMRFLSLHPDHDSAYQ